VTWRERLEAAWTPVRRWYEGHSERDRLIIVGIAVAAMLSVLYVGVVVPLGDRRAQVAQDIEKGLTRIDHAQRLVSSLQTLEAKRADLRARLKVARRRLLPGDSDTLGAAALQERANALATEHGVTVRTTQVLRSEAADPYRKVSVRLTLSGPLRGLAAMLAGLEYDHELVIPFLELSRRGGVARSTGPTNISATLEVAGFVSGDEEGAQDVDGADELPGPPLPPEGGRDFIGPPQPAREVA
jgi:type II secretory pathway component PulM